MRASIWLLILAFLPAPALRGAPPGAAGLVAGARAQQERAQPEQAQEGRAQPGRAQPDLAQQGRAQPGLAAKDFAPLLRAHSHNDYARRAPLEDALREGFCSIEADLVAIDGEVLVAHERASARPGRSLRALYLEPLRARVRANGGRVYPGGPLGVRLLLDFKDAPETLWPLVDALLAEYDEMLTTWDADGVPKERALRAVISGRKPWELVARDATRRVSFDASLREAERRTGGARDARITLCSEPWKRHLSWIGGGEIPAEDLQRVRALVARARRAARPLRFWGVPAKARVWKRLFDEGVDVLHTDNLRGLGAFLRARRVPAMPEGWTRELGGDDGVELWSSKRVKPPLRAWLVRADLARPALTLRPVRARGAKRSATCRALAKDCGARALINASFFSWTEAGLAPYGAFALDGVYETRARPFVESKASGARYDIARSALVWFGDERAPELAWIGWDAKAARHLLFEKPHAHAKGAPSTSPAPSARPLGAPTHVLQAGPMLLRRGRVLVPASANGERMFVHDKRHPRTAFGLRGQVAHLLVVDGRSSISRGVSLVELATMLRELGVRDAINLDGGGSSALVLDGQVRNTPSGGVERAVATALALFQSR